MRIQTKKEKAPPLTDPFYHQYLQLRVVVTILVFFVLWTVKATFLIFYRILFECSSTFLRMWWVVVALTFASFWVCIGSTLTLCGSVNDLYNFRRCLPCGSPSRSSELTFYRKMRFTEYSACLESHLQILVCSECTHRFSWYVANDPSPANP